LDINVLEGYAVSISRAEVTLKTEEAFSFEAIQTASQPRDHIDPENGGSVFL
jgi:hypothetical protein